MKSTLRKALALALCTALALIVPAPLGAAAAETPLRTVTILSKNDFSSEIKVADAGKYDSYKIFEQNLADLGIKLSIETVDNSSFATVVQTRMAAAVDLPDIISAAFDEIGADDIMPWADAGLVLPLNGLLEQYDQDGSILKYYNERCPGALGSNIAPDGNLYWFSYLANNIQYNPKTGEMVPNTTNLRTLSIRQDWLEATGQEIKYCYTPDELFDVLKAFQDGDANGNGVVDEFVAVNINNFDNGISAAYGFQPSGSITFGPDNKAFSTFRSPLFPDYIRFMKKLYDAGLYDTSAMGGDLFSSELITENKAALTYNYALWGDYEKQIAATDKAQYTPILLDLDGMDNGFHVVGEQPNGTYNYYFLTSSCKDPEAVINLFDYIYTDEYALLDMAGIEGVSYEFDSLGIPKELDTSSLPVEQYTRLFMTGVGLYALPAINTTKAYMPLEYFDGFNPMNAKTKFMEDYIAIMDKADFIVSGLQLAVPSLEEMAAINEISGDLSTYSEELLTDLILGKRSIDDLDKYLDEMDSLGLAQYVSIIQARRDRYLAAVGE